jgi:glyoxylase-like metal-dependent hydrolase (beta-lactamase superfamily II)
MTADLADGTWYLDTEYQGATRLIATAVLESDLGLLLVDPGPTSCLDTLLARLDERGYDLDDVHALLLTHIHLDHAGAAGTLAQAAPHVEVYVHERGAPHLVRPARLLKSARRIYGDAMDRLWGAFEAVPEARVHALEGGETLALGGCTLEVAYTPGHAKHHVSYLDTETGVAFVGDVGGMRVTGCDTVIPVMPPPDIDVPAWHTSLRALRAWTPTKLFLTHFGPASDVPRHLDVMDAALDLWADDVRRMLALTGDDAADDETLALRFQDAKFSVLRATTPTGFHAPYEQFGQPRETWTGLARYWRTREQA